MIRRSTLSLVMAACLGGAAGAQGPMLSSPGAIGPIIGTCAVPMEGGGCSGAPSSSFPVPEDQLEQAAAKTPEQEQAEADAGEFRGLVLSGRKVRPAVRRLMKLTWHRKLPIAQKLASDTDRPILWVQALGGLSGRT